MRRHKPTLEDLQKFQDQVYVSALDIYHVVPLTMQNCRELVHEILDDMEREGLPKFISRPLLVPSARVLEKLEPLTRASKNGR